MNECASCFRVTDRAETWLRVEAWQIGSDLPFPVETAAMLCSAACLARYGLLLHGVIEAES